MDEIIELINATRTLQSSAERFELHIPQLQLERASINVVLGRSGCGKSTLLDALSLLAPFDNYDCFTLGQAKGMPKLNVKKSYSRHRAQWQREELGYIHQGGALLSFLSARENILLPAKLSGKKLKRGAIEKWAQRLDIEEHLDKYPQALSIGQRQRVSIARALIHQPSLVLADEPTGALDPISALEAKNLLIESVKLSGACAIIVTHDAELFHDSALRYFNFHIKRSPSLTQAELYEVSQAEKGIKNV